MSDIETKIREAAKNALESGDVKLVIGWGAGSVPFKTTPVFIEKPEDVDKLVWNPACVNNLAVYLPKMAKDCKVGIVAKPVWPLNMSPANWLLRKHPLVPNTSVLNT